MDIIMDVEDAMSRLGNNKKLYMLLLKKFNGAAMLEDLKNSLAGGDTEAAAAHAHTIKGLAANLSFKDLQAKALAVELALKSGGADTAEISESMAATEEAVRAWISGNE